MGNFLSNNQADLAKSLADQNRQMEENQARQTAGNLHMPYLNLVAFPIDLQALSLMTKENSIRSQSAPVYKDKKEIKIVTVNPQNPLLLSLLDEWKNDFTITLYYVSQSGLSNLQNYYEKVLIPHENTSEQIVVEDTKIAFEQLSNISSSNTISQVLSNLFGAAIYQNSSDIHLEPEDHLLKVRFRIDGVLKEVLTLDKTWQKQITSRIKLLAKLKLNVNNEAQDGRFTILNQKEELDIRVSVLPSSFGEAIVLRLLGIGIESPGFDELGINGIAYDRVKEALQKSTGMVIATGPTGSGKTTSLYAFLKELNQPGVKIITIEDPVEYQVSGIQQTPIDHRVDFSFDKALRSVLRQDPDVVMVGEIRDPETGATALQAALTGHVVLTTLHTNDASGAIPRLLTMGIKPYVISPAINVIIAQRLVRKLCSSCKTVANLDQVTLEKVNKILNEIPSAAQITLPKELVFYSAPGCDACGGVGYKGRIGVYEVISITDEMRELILTEPSGIAIKKAAVLAGTITMTQDGLLKALNKITDVTEVFRVTI